MRNFIILNFLFVLLSCFYCRGQEEVLNQIAYQVQPDFEQKILDVQFHRSTDEKGELTLIYENESMGEINLFNCLQNVEVSPQAKIEFVKDSSLIKIKGKPNQQYKISYNIVKDYKQKPLNRYRYRPIIDSTYFHILGTKLLVYPDNLFEKPTTKTNLKIQWIFKDKKAVFHSSFGFDKIQNLKVSQNDLHNSFFVGGDFRRYSFSYKGKPVYFVSRGKWKTFTDQEAFEVLKKTVENQHDFWNDSLAHPFSVSLIPTYEEGYHSVGGSALSNSFISFVSNNKETSKELLTWLYNHELMHKWIFGAIQIEEDVKQYWFSEGFTEYYAYKLMFKYDQLTLEEYINTLNKEILIPHGKDSYANTPNSEMTFQNYWSNHRELAKLPYRRGLLYAFLIDNQIKKQSNFTKSLDDLMFDFYAKAQQDDSFAINEDVFQLYLTSYLEKKNAMSEFKSYIIEGNFIYFEDDLTDGLSIDNSLNAPSFKIDHNQSQKLLIQLKK